MLIILYLLEFVCALSFMRNLVTRENILNDFSYQIPLNPFFLRSCIADFDYLLFTGVWVLGYKYLILMGSKLSKLPLSI